tara:strand:+ start:22102 stop:23331 length:1230 start_codon:yes stop_codon:yes gene_type:complete
MKCFLPIKKKTSFDGYSIKPFNSAFKLTNVSPGPATIDPSVIQDIANELSNTDIYGSTPLEISHRSPEFSSIFQKVNTNLKSFMKIPDCFSIIWTPAGGHGQFSAIPMNMNHIFEKVKGCYIVTGTWSSRAYNESKKFIQSENLTQEIYQHIPQVLQYDSLPEDINIPNDADYLYLCSNETVNGLEFRKDGYSYPSRKKLGKAKLLVDMSSDFLMKEVDWEEIDMAFACTSKNMGAAGANVIVIRTELLENMKYNTNQSIPCVLDWKLYYNTKSLYNTPAVFNFYLFDKILDKYILEMKNIEHMDTYNQKKAEKLYHFLDNSEIYFPCVKDKKSRSNINIPFIVGNGNDTNRSNFLEHCFHHNLVGLRTQTPFSYHSLGLIEPLRISLYNGIKMEDVDRIIEVMDAFEI